MSLPVVILIVVAIVAAGVLAWLALKLLHHMRQLAVSVRSFQQEVEPLVLEIQAGAELARDRAQELEERQQT